MRSAQGAGASAMTPAQAAHDARRFVAPAMLAVVLAGTVVWALPRDLGAWRSAGIVLGWAGIGLLAASLVLMVRQARLAAWMGGLDTMYRWHHRSGTVAYVLLLLHPLALAAEGWSESPAVAWQTITPWTSSAPMLLGWISLLLLMAGLATTFSLRLSYRRWRGCHYLLALAVASGLGHVYVLLGDALPFLLLAAMAAGALAWRLLGSDLGLDALPYRVTAVAHRAAQVVEVTLAPCAVPMQIAAGQFVLAAFDDGPHFHGCREFHPYTVSGFGPDHGLRIGIKALGTCTRNIQRLEPGVFVRLQGPFGDFLAKAGDAAQLWVAGGIGITPFVAALRAGAIPPQTALIYLHRTAADAPFLDEIRQIAGQCPELQFIAQASGAALPDLDALLAQVGSIDRRQVHVCGPAALVERLRPRLLARGVPPGHILTESFDFR
jgi:predicted ferric reductase